eukprot:Protomagalhaensia_sp_Gyna_25__524@NODE_1246_length_2026_cov_34_518369_g927_i1_p1_GENE_NODE_1246_length_2026_cov_34_518369_g927_i1NODE_1246_length_2026_cov_34_518369_g927_i1_p1_ORF_typecomplete_len468_score105_71tRNAsynt_1g/PF09334_11/1_2e17tRNAsynt_1/PF00133_22/5_7e17tRNAsynt_1e/PF01406_19/5_4e13Anticodon_1/PF08264_13/4_2e03Anticodon_1/PF08264_13/4_3e10tRNAsynt_1f/PF01921_18/0_016RBD/PF02196_15/0_3_NODE_1246_length_2026_cov_34_518369_g927_i14721875
MYGQTPSSFNIKPEDLTMDVFNYIYLQTDQLPASSNISEDILRSLRDAFVYWYPMNLRCSGKDLVPNHLTMSLFHHAAIWPNNPELWPRGFFVNGHILLDSEKMSKSTGNFLSLDEACETFSTDGTRLALADAGDSVDDANFERQTANTCLMKLYVMCQFVEEILQKQKDGQLRNGEKSHLDRMIENEMSFLVTQTREDYENMLMRDVLKHGFFEFLTIKDTYRNMLSINEEYHESVILKWVELFCVIISPIACFSTEFIWSCLLKKSNLVVDNQRWPSVDPVDHVLHRQFQLLLEVAETVRKQLEKGSKKAKVKPDAAVLFVSKEFQPWQQDVLILMKERIPIDSKTNLPIDPKYIDSIKNDENLKQKIGPSKMKDALAFCSYQIKEEVKPRGVAALELTLPFNEQDLLSNYQEFLQRSIGIKKLHISDKDNTPTNTPLGKELTKRDLALPGRPSPVFYTLPRNTT